MEMKASIFTLFLSTIVLLVACKKIATPDENSKLIFGEWRYISNSGGFSGGGGSTKFNSNSWISFNEKGIYKAFDGTKKVEKHRFKIETSDDFLKYRINFNGINSLDYAYAINGDSLYLNEAVNDGFSFLFIRK